MRLKGKVALISGVGSRFGKATAYLFAREQAKVALLSRKKDLIEPLASEINEKGGTAKHFVCDSTDALQVKKVIDRVVASFGGIDILLNNVGGSYSKQKNLDELAEEFWTAVILNNLKSAFLVSKYTLPHMISQRSGVIINVAASFTTRMDGNAAYSTAKAGIVGMTKSMAREYGPSNIRVNAVSPGVIRAESTGYDFDKYVSRIDKRGQSEDVAYAVLFLASDEASWISGQTITVDGGEEVFTNIKNPL